MITNYIYLLQEREFIKTNENIYKVGRTKKENYQRFNQYPKGSVLLFQIICNNCEKIETQVIKEFKEDFNQRKDIGNEYFQGDYKLMIDKIYTIIKNEICIVEDNNDELETTDEMDKTENDDSDSQNEEGEIFSDYKNDESNKCLLSFTYTDEECKKLSLIQKYNDELNLKCIYCEKIYCNRYVLDLHIKNYCKKKLYCKKERK
jgi:hypothetical protein